MGGIFLRKIKFNNDEAFFESLCSRYFERIYFYCKRLVRGQEQFMDFVEECTQNTFLEARKQISKLRNHPNIEGWLYTTARNLINSSYRSMYIKRKYEVSMDDVLSNYICEPEMDFEELFNSAVDLDKLSAEVLQKLTSGEYELYMDYFVNNASVSDLSRKYNISVTATTTRIYRLKKKIKRMVREYFMNT